MTCIRPNYGKLDILLVLSTFVMQVCVIFVVIWSHSVSGNGLCGRKIDVDVLSFLFEHDEITYPYVFCNNLNSSLCFGTRSDGVKGVQLINRIVLRKVYIM